MALKSFRLYYHKKGTKDTQSKIVRATNRKAAKNKISAKYSVTKIKSPELSPGRRAKLNRLLGA